MMKSNLQKRKNIETAFSIFCHASTAAAILILLFIFVNIIYQGVGYLSLDFLKNFPSATPRNAGIKSALFGSIWLLFCIIIISVPLGIGSAIYIEELMPKNKLKKFIQLNIANLAGVPSIVYGILGLVVFVRLFYLDRSILTGSLTLSIMILPVIIIASQEALKSAPFALKEAAYAVGATKWQAIFYHVLPFTLPGMMTGVVLAISRAIGEAAPLIIIGGLTYVAFVPQGIMDEFTALPIQIFNWASRPQKEFHGLAAAAILVLMFILLLFNSFAIYLRYKFQNKDNL